MYMYKYKSKNMNMYMYMYRESEHSLWKLFALSLTVLLKKNVNLTDHEIVC